MTISQEVIFKAKTHEASWLRAESGTLTAHKPKGDFVKLVLKQDSPNRQITAHMKKVDLIELLRELTS